MYILVNLQLRLLVLITFAGSFANAQSISTFTSVVPAAQTAQLKLPSSHTFQRIIRTGNALTLGGTLGSNLDFTGYVPIAGSSTHGYLSINSETAPAQCAILTMQFEPTTRLWSVTQSGKVDLPFDDLGNCSNFCSGTVTPNNTIMICEEATGSVDGNADGYNDLGWVIEIYPGTRKVINHDGTGGVDKLWAMGNQSHENVTIKADQSVAYWGADNGTNGFVYKFVPAAAGNFSSGDLYVLETTGTGSGTWKKVANTTIAERNNTILASVAAGAYNFNRVEDMEIGPDGKIYFASTATGRVFRFTDDGATVSNLEVFIDNVAFDINGTPATFEWPDNLAFDGEGNLWVLQDGGDNHIWVFCADHTATNPKVKIFANTPAGCEPTGITFSPDYKYIFLSIQHPSGDNTSTQTDAAGNEVAFDNNTTIVIARTENLGNGSVLPVKFVDLQLRASNQQVTLQWQATGIIDTPVFIVERSLDCQIFTSVAKVAAQPAAQANYVYVDKQLPFASKAFYRVKACDANGYCVFSATKMAKLSANTGIKIFPQPVRDHLTIQLNSINSDKIEVTIYSSDGRQVYKSSQHLLSASGVLTVPTSKLSKGSYVITLRSNAATFSKQFVK